MNRQILLQSHPEGMPQPANFKLSCGSIPQPGASELLIQSLYLSVDPYMRGQLGGRLSSHPPFRLNECLFGDGLGRVVESKSARFKAGDLIAGRLQWADYALLSETAAQRIDVGNLPLSAALGPLGMTGMSAYFGFLENAQAKTGETVVVSGAAGAVGSLVGQIAKIRGCRVVGIAGSEEKRSVLINELGFDAAVDYKSERFAEELRAACPDGVDIYFDNVGGAVTDRVLAFLNKFGRIVLCGQISTYHLQKPDEGMRHFRTLIVKSALAKGFIVWDYRERFPEGASQVAEWIREGRLKWKETILEGLENAPQALLGLFSGKNIGKQLVKL